MKNWKGYVRKRTRRNLRTCPGFCPERQMTIKIKIKIACTKRLRAD
jgi:hypothetical protein